MHKTINYRYFVADKFLKIIYNNCENASFSMKKTTHCSSANKYPNHQTNHQCK